MKTMVSDRDARLIAKIARRAARELRFDFLQTRWELILCHANGNPLRLAELLKAPRFDFTHDLIGIRDHLDKSTGQLKDCFLPRYSGHE